VNRPLVVAAHGSRDPRSASAMRDLTALLAGRWDGPVTVGFLDFDRPNLVEALQAAGDGAVVAPALLTHAYHGRVDLPAAVCESGVRADIAPVLGPDPLLSRAMAARVRRYGRVDGIAVLAAGTRDCVARQSIHQVAAGLGAILSAPFAVGFASAGPPNAADAVTELRKSAAGDRIVAASYFLAPGRLWDLARGAAMAAGAIAVTAPLAAPIAPEVARVLVARATAVRLPR
jgi:sirohydrochlorin ferrochelatase